MILRKRNRLRGRTPSISIMFKRAVGSCSRSRSIAGWQAWSKRILRLSCSRRVGALLDHSMYPLKITPAATIQWLLTGKSDNTLGNWVSKYRTATDNVILNLRTIFINTVEHYKAHPLYLPTISLDTLGPSNRLYFCTNFVIFGQRRFFVQRLQRLYRGDFLCNAGSGPGRRCVRNHKTYARS